MIDLDQHHLALPVCSLMEYIAQNVTKSVILVTKARIIKAVALVELGYINQAYMIYKRILDSKDLPKHGARSSEYAGKADGSNYHIDQSDKYHNDLTPEDDKNQPALTLLQKELTPEQVDGLRAYCSPSVVEQLQFLRCAFLIRLGEQENVEDLDKAGLRFQLLQTAEDGLRQSLKQLQTNFEIADLRNKISNEKQKLINTD